MPDAFVLYQWRLASIPVYLHDAEILFALHAHDIARNLHDANGRLLPLYFQMPEIGGNVWFHPVIVYVMALSVKLFSFSEWSLRLPSVVVGMTDVMLMYLIGRRLFRSEMYGLVAAVLLAMTPAHFIHSRVAMDYLYPVPFALAWLFCLVKFEQESRSRLLLFAGLALGAGMYSYLGAVVLNNPVYLFFVGSSNWVDSTRRAGVFLLPMAVFIGAGFWEFAAGKRSRLAWLVRLLHRLPAELHWLVRAERRRRRDSSTGARSCRTTPSSGVCQQHDSVQSREVEVLARQSRARRSAAADILI